MVYRVSSQQEQTHALLEVSIAEDQAEWVPHDAAREACLTMEALASELSLLVTLSKKGKSASSQVVVRWWSGGSQLTTN